MNSDISHHLSEDGLTLKSTAVINGRETTATVAWDSQETATSENYLKAVAAAEKYFKTLSTDAHQEVSTNRVRIYRLGFFNISVGVFSGNKWDVGRITFGRTSWVTNTTLTTIRWSTLHKDLEYKPEGLVFGFGGSNKAFMLSLKRRKR